MKNRSILLTFSLLLILATASIFISPTASAWKLDSFEDGATATVTDVDRVPVWSTSTAAYSTTRSHTGSYSMYFGADKRMVLSRETMLNDANVYSFWINIGTVGSGGNGCMASIVDAQNISMVFEKSGTWQTFDGSSHDTGISATADTWYQIIMTLIPASATYNLQIKDAGGSSLYSSANNNWGPSTSPKTLLFESNNDAATCYFDDVRYDYNRPIVDVNAWINQPTSASTVSGTYSVDFNVEVADGNEMAVSLYLSDTALGWDFPIFTDYNIHDFDNNASFNCADHDFTNSTNCTYSWDSWKKLAETGDGTKYLDLNAYITNGTYDENKISSPAFTFSNEPDFDVNFVYVITGNLDPENGINTVSVDANSRTFGRHVSVSSYQWDENSALISNDTNVLVTDGNVGDRNYALTVNFSYDYNADTFVDSNWQVVHIKSYPQDLNFVWTPFKAVAKSNTSFTGSATTPPSIKSWNYGFPDSNIYTQVANYTFINSGVQSVCLTVQNFDDLNRTECNDVNVLGKIAIQFWDENTDTKLAPTTLTINDVNYLANLSADGYLDINLSSFSTGTYTIKASTSTYSLREWVIDLNQESFYDENYGLLVTTLGQAVEFQIYLPDKTTLVTNSLIEMSLTDNNFISGIKSTGGTGKVSFFVNPNDANYLMSFTFAGIDYNYDETLVTIEIPKDEVSLALISPFDVGIGGLATQDYNGLTGAKTVQLFSETIDFHVIDVNASGYVPRSYAIRFSGGEDTYSLQPYLLKTGDASIIEYTTISDADLTALGFVNLIMKKNISGVGLVTVESGTTDSAGKALFSAESNEEYIMLVYYDDILIATQTYNMTETSYFISINLVSIDFTNPTRSGVYATFDPSEGVVYHASPFIINATVHSDLGSISKINVAVWHFDRNVYQSTLTTGVSNGIGIPISLETDDLNIGYPLVLNVWVTLTDGNVLLLRKTYSFFDADDKGDDLLITTILVRGDFGCPIDTTQPCPALIMISLFITLVLVAGLSMTFTTDFAPLSGFAIVILGFFVIANWVPVSLWVIMALAGVLVMAVSRRVTS